MRLFPGRVRCDGQSCHAALTDRQKLILAPIWQAASMLMSSTMDVTAIIENMVHLSEYQARAQMQIAEKATKQHRLVLLVSHQQQPFFHSSSCPAQNWLKVSDMTIATTIQDKTIQAITI